MTNYAPQHMAPYFDFNTAEPAQPFDVLPKGTLAKVRMTIRPGGFDEPSQGWTGGYATRSEDTGSIYLDAEFIVLEGPFAKRKVWTLIGLYSPKGEAWTHMGRTTIRSLLNSARGIAPEDQSPNAQAARRIAGFHELDGLTFIARIDVEKDTNGDLRNVIKHAVEPGHKDYVPLMHGAVAPAPAPAFAPAAAVPAATPPAYAPTAAAYQPAPSQPAARPGPISKPAWAQ